MIELASPDTTCRVSPRDGGRVATLRVHGHPLLIEAGGHPMRWGSFPMAPFAGRVRDGRFSFDGATYELPLGLPPHAIHGTVYTQPWTVTASDETSVEMGCALGPDWSLGGAAGQRIELGDDRLVCALWVTAGERSMPAEIGWHPWFVKPDSAVIRFGRKYERDESGIPSGRLIDPGPGPWDDCLVEAIEPPRLQIGPIEVTISSDCDHWVVFDELTHATCVEPQSGPPDAFNSQPHVLRPGQTLRRTMTISWAL